MKNEFINKAVGIASSRIIETCGMTEKEELMRTYADLLAVSSHGQVNGWTEAQFIALCKKAWNHVENEAEPDGSDLI